MLYLLQQLFINKWGVLRVFKSITMRASIAFVIAFLFMMIFGKPFIAWLKKKKYGDSAREEGPQSHWSKSGTPTMGGLLIIGAMLFATSIAGNFTNKFIIFLFIITILFTTIGFYDDFLKLTKHKKGLSGKKKIFGQLIITSLTFYFIYKYGLINKEIDFSIVNPIIKNSFLYITPVLFFIFMMFVIIGSSNAVNLTDGLDGLVSGPIIVVSLTLLIITYLTGHYEYAKYLNLYYVRDAAEMTVYLASIIGALTGFLWFNFYPAQVFMGDTGSLTLGGILGIIVIFLKQELLLPIAGFIFILEALSVMIQVWHFKTFGRRVFKMAPIHHHFEMLGIPETKVTIRFWIITIMTCLLTFVILKVR
ncbi:MAG: phospho-N-acetylmuramoyl-pentapeptide-transferase [Leptotrichiaceae bacterium]|nr:phospho-N-acetylmuramoyl-pentapeptide-transferase [Leptotrichiaceae bacterium]MBP6280462.1 phospho-N-acetylmuramoyl-pentapeptide-transferase [Leptotrichiaceae bacterium]MBP7099945.1 phospho-N-acetylmuramoyl-pentapeptide-transferase [Leptotrichiaceae bacterium]MBP7725310.1 phospho-N-acetylmuramoyl-pentapeptide-transferase [Leptotrichiaceae bacterium]MBP9629086.1 phospho-N-acetylmuramoyl-pentapeptide-transferase [Leptotrichiaceae bacterium]